MSEISTVAIPNRHIAVLKQRVPEELALCTSNLLRRPRTRMLELGGRQCSVLQDAGAACGRLSEISLIMLVVLESRDSHAHSWTALPRVCSTASTGSLPMPRLPPSRSKSDEPEHTGMGKLLSFEILNGYVGSFDESPKKEIEVSQGAGITSLQPVPPLLPLVGHIPELPVDVGRPRRAGIRCLFPALYYTWALFVDRRHELSLGGVRGFVGFSL